MDKGRGTARRAAAVDTQQSPASERETSVAMVPAVMGLAVPGGGALRPKEDVE